MVEGAAPGVLAPSLPGTTICAPPELCARAPRGRALPAAGSGTVLRPSLRPRAALRAGDAFPFRELPPAPCSSQGLGSAGTAQPFWQGKGHLFLYDMEWFQP